ncbi:MAG: tyrosine-type recombinase/integrase [Euzebya sp.]
MAGIVSKYTTDSGKERWRARWDLHRGPDGQRRQRTKAGFATKRDAQRFLREQIADIDRGLNHTGTKLSLADYLTQWLRHKRLRPTTHDNYRTCLLVHVLPRIGGIDLADIDHHVLDSLYRELEMHGKAAGPCRTAGITCSANRCRPDRHAGLSTKSVQLVHGAVRAALQDAVRDGRLGRNPADLAQAPKRTAAQRRVTSEQVWTLAQAHDFLTRTEDDELAALWVLALATGLRRAELVGLTWAHLDLVHATLEVKRTTTTVRGRAIPSLGKTSAAHRRIHLDEPVPERLRHHRTREHDRRGTISPNEPVFTDRHGRPLHPGRLTKRFQALVRDLGLPPIGLHGLRHTAATLMLNHGVPVHLVANRLGHTDASTTLSVYVHVMPDDDRIAAKAISHALFPEPP